MHGKIDLLITPPTLEDVLTIEHTNELILLDKEPKAYDSYDIPLANYGLAFEPCSTDLAPEKFSSLPDIPPPRLNTYVLNVKRMVIEDGKVKLQTNYTTMRSQFAVQRWTPVLIAQERALAREMASDFSAPLNMPCQSDIILKYVIPIGQAMIVETADDQILMEERGKVEIPGKYHPAPAGGCETTDWRVFPEPFRCIKGEAWEETALLPGKDYGDVALIGIARDYTEAFRPTFTYHTKTPWELEKAIQQANSIAPEAGEHERLFGVPAHPEGLLEFCITHQEKIIGNGLGALLAFGQYKFGRAWLDASIQELGKKGSQIDERASW